MGRTKSKIVMKKTLTPKQEMFCREYLIDLNATQAAIRAGYSEKTANVIGPENLAKPCVQEVIQELKKEREKRVEIDADWVLRRLKEIDEMDVADILNDDGELLPVKDWPKCWRQTISGLDISTTTLIEDVETVLKKIKWPDKLRNIELLGKHISIKAFRDQVGISDPDGEPIKITGINIGFVEPEPVKEETEPEFIDDE